MSPSRELVLRRRRLREAVLDDRPPAHRDVGTKPLRGVEGIVVDASPHLLVLAASDGSEVRLPVSATASVWYAGRAGVSALHPGRHAVVRPSATGGFAAERIWVDIARVTGLIAARSGRQIEVDGGRHRPRTTLVIPGEALARIQVRHPRLDPGSLIDVIGVRRNGEIHAVQPATKSAQPALHADQPPPERRVGSVSRMLRGTATWYDHPGYGAAYPALDPYGDAGGCGTGPASTLPYLSLACELDIRNDCSGRGTRLPVIECGCLAARFSDRCVRCGTSPRGRIVELTRAAFVDLGGDLDSGCFNVTAWVGQ
jgi:hypothetical protein